MKVDPDGLLASLIESPILLKPYASIENQLERKATYVQSRLARLQGYNDIANAGLPLNVSQNHARTKLDEVLKHLDYVKNQFMVTIYHRPLRFDLLSLSLDNPKVEIVQNERLGHEIDKQSATALSKTVIVMVKVHWRLHCDEEIEKMLKLPERIKFIVRNRTSFSRADVALRSDEYATTLKKLRQPVQRHLMKNDAPVWSESQCNIIYVSSLRLTRTRRKRFPHLLGIVQRDRTLFEKSIRAADILLTNKLDCFRSATISHAHVYGEILLRLNDPSSSKAFLSGAEGAIILTPKELNVLQRLRWAFLPSYRDCISLNQMEAKAAEASQIIAAILSGSNMVVDKQSGLRGHEALELLEKVKRSDFFSKNSWISEAADTAAGDVSSDTVPLSATPEAPNEEGSTVSPFVGDSAGNRCHLSENENSPQSIKNESTVLEETETNKNGANSVITDETVGEQSAILSPVSAPTTETTEDHNDIANISDSGNGTVSPDSDMVADAKTEVRRKYNPVAKENRKQRPLFRSGETGAAQERERSDQKSRATNRNQNGTNSTFTPTKQRNNPRKRTDRTIPSSFIGTQEYSNNNENWRPNGRANYSRSYRFSNYQSSSPFTYEPGVSRRPAPTTLGFIFAGK